MEPNRNIDHITSKDTTLEEEEDVHDTNTLRLDPVEEHTGFLSKDVHLSSTPVLLLAISTTALSISLIVICLKLWDTGKAKNIAESKAAGLQLQLTTERQMTKDLNSKIYTKETKITSLEQELEEKKATSLEGKLDDIQKLLILTFSTEGVEKTEIENKLKELLKDDPIVNELKEASDRTRLWILKELVFLKFFKAENNDLIRELKRRFDEPTTIDWSSIHDLIRYSL